MQCVTARSSFSALKLFANGQNIRVCRFSGLTYRPNVLKNNIFDSHWKSLNITCKSLNQRSYCNTPEKVVNSQDCIQNKREQNSVQDIDVNAITNGDPVLEKKLKVLFLEVEVRRQEGGRIPPSIEEKQWKVLLELPSFSGRRKYLEFLWKMEMKKLNDRRKKEENRILFEKVIEERKIREEEHILYALNHNTIFLRFYDTFINNCSHVRLMQAMLYGQKLVFDCGYEEYMTRRESDNCSKQLMLAFSENRDHVEPFDLHFCNVNRDSNTFIKLHKHIPTLYNPEFPLNITEKSYLELFPKKELIYLTPNAREEMRVFDHNAVYIIGALVDKGAEQPLSLAKAKRENLRIAKLPIDRYLSWGDGGKKSLTLNQMVMILLEVKKNGDWHKALEHVPKRKLHREKIQEDHLRTSSVMFTKEFRGGGWYMLGAQSLSVLCLASWTILTNFILLWTINKIIPIRMDPNEELLGADLVEHHIRHNQAGVSRAMSALKPFVTEEHLDKVTTIGYNPGHDSYIETNFFNNNLLLEMRTPFTGNTRSKTARNNGSNAVAALQATKNDNFPQKYAWIE